MNLVFTKKLPRDMNKATCRVCGLPMRRWGWIYDEPWWCCASGQLCGPPGTGWDLVEADPWYGLLLYWMLTTGKKGLPDE